MRDYARIAEDLGKALDLIRDPAHWVKEAWFSHPDGYTDRADDTCSFCAAGALRHVTNQMFDATGPSSHLRACQMLLARGVAPHVRDLGITYSNNNQLEYIAMRPETLITEFNDVPESTHAQVVAAFEEAIRIAESRA